MATTMIAVAYGLTVLTLPAGICYIAILVAIDGHEAMTRRAQATITNGE